MSTQTIKCGRCKCPLEGPAQPKGHDRFSCPRCGNGDTLDRVMAEVREHVKEQTSRMMHETITKGARGNKFIKVTSKLPPQRNRRFICNVKL